MGAIYTHHFLLVFMYSCLVTHDKAYFFKLSICSLVKPVACMICRRGNSKERRKTGYLSKNGISFKCSILFNT